MLTISTNPHPKYIFTGHSLQAHDINEDFIQNSSIDFAVVHFDIV
jgi:hypothetical protein